MLEQVRVAYREAVFDTDRQRALQVIAAAVGRDATPEEIVFEVVIPSIEETARELGDRAGASLAQHFLASQIGAEVVEAMIPRFARAPESGGRVIIGTSRGDFHGLGKRIVIGCLRAHLIEATDLGLNVAPERFVDEAVRLGAPVIGISSMMVHTARGEQGCLGVRRVLRERGLEEGIKLVVGGAPYRHDPELYRAVGADAWAENGLLAGRVIGGLLGEARP